MGSLLSRVISALIALVIIFGIAYWVGAQGLIALSLVVIFLAILEYQKVAFTPLGAPPLMRFFFVAMSVLLGTGVLARNFFSGLFADSGLFFWPDWSLLLTGIFTGLFFATSLWITRGRMSNQKLLSALCMSSLGLLYCVIFPIFAVKCLFLMRGIAWFFALLVIVFIGDTCAYFGGRTLGKRKLMPDLSPKKTIEGAVSGALGSAVAAALFALWQFPEVPLWSFVAIALICAFVAQMGDLFESLLKRVADVKDSGNIMPGHGGFLDRLDGVYFSAPVFYAYAFLVESLLLF